MTQAQRKLVSYEDYAAMPEDGKRYEILEGRLEMVPGPNTEHQAIVVELLTRLVAYVKQHSLGRVFVAPLDVILEPHTVVQPDIVFISKEHAGRIARRGIEGAPDLAIEVVSPGSRSRDHIQKLRIYERRGVPEYWIVSPDDASVTVLVLEGERFGEYAEVTGNETIPSRVLPDLRLTPAEIFGHARE